VGRNPCSAGDPLVSHHALDRLGSRT